MVQLRKNGRSVKEEGDSVNEEGDIIKKEAGSIREMEKLGRLRQEKGNQTLAMHKMDLAHF